jgi:hypothetical protein
MHLPAKPDVHLSAKAHVPSKGLKVLQPRADTWWLTIVCRDSMNAALASPTLCSWTNGAMSAPLSCQIGQHLREGGRRTEGAPRHGHRVDVGFESAAADPGAAFAQGQSSRLGTTRRAPGGEVR